MSLRELLGHPDLVRQLPRDPQRRCPVPIRHGGATWRCSQVARWQVKDQPPQCGVHASRTLRRLLAGPDAASAGGGS